ncbi:hypothetical protein FRAHR75_280015 [Frankia sp. Hr75.2]|nr:hypothetical protein FRAHR75_280015 [Frankia sp. Hr75.2]
MPIYDRPLLDIEQALANGLRALRQPDDLRLRVADLDIRRSSVLPPSADVATGLASVVARHALPGGKSIPDLRRCAKSRPMTVRCSGGRS